MKSDRCASQGALHKGSKCVRGRLGTSVQRALLGAVVAFAPAAALAGDGTVLPVTVDGATGVATPVADGVSPYDRLDLSFKVYVDSPRTTAEMDEIRQSMQQAAQLMCDYTDGLVSLQQIEFVTHASEKHNADVIWERQPLRAVGSPGQFGVPGGTLAIYGVNRNHHSSPTTIAHEFGHLLGDIFDSYADQRGFDSWTLRSSAFTGRQAQAIEGVGNFFVHPIHGWLHSESVFPGTRSAVIFDPSDPNFGLPLYGDRTNPDSAWWEQNHTVMGASTSGGQLCRNRSGLAPSEVNPTWGNTGCRTHADCAWYLTGWDAAAGAPMEQPGDFVVCDAAPRSFSELAVAGNFDQDRWDRARGVSQAPPVTPPAQYAQDGKQLVISGFLYPTTDTQPAGLNNTTPMKQQLLPECQNFDPMTGECTNPLPAGWCQQFAGAYGDPPRTGATANAVGLDFQCGNAGQGTSECPGSNATGHPAQLDSAQCDRCLITDTSECAAPLGLISDATPGLCGNGAIDDGLAAGNEFFEQCDLGDPATVDPNGPAMWDHDNNAATPHVELSCADVFSPARIALGDAVHGSDAAARPDLRPMGGVVHCQPNCMYDLSRCSFPFTPEDSPNLEDAAGNPPDSTLYIWEVHQSSDVSLATELIDSAGQAYRPAPPWYLLFSDNASDPLSLSPTLTHAQGRGVDLTQIEPSSHVLFSFLKRLERSKPGGWTSDGNAATADWPLQIYRETWLLTVGLDEGEVGGVSGVFHELRRFRLEFDVDYAANTSVLVAVNGQDPATMPHVYAGLPDPGDPWGPLPFSAPTPLLDRGSGVTSLDLEVDVRDLFVRRVQESDCSMPWAGPPTTASEPRCLTHLRGRVRNGTWEGAPNPIEDAGGLVEMHARHALVQRTLPDQDNPAVNRQVFYEVPQYPDLPYLISQYAPSVDAASYAQTYYKYAYSAATQRYETANATWAQLSGAHCSGSTCNPADLPIDTDLQSDWGRLVGALGKYQASCLDPQSAMPTTCPVGNPADRWLSGGVVPTVYNQIDIEPPANCGNVTFGGGLSATGVDFDAQTQVTIVLDRSGSMGTQDVPIAASTDTTSRLDYVKEAARVMYGAMATAGGVAGPRLALHYYSDEVTFELPGVAHDSNDDPIPCDHSDPTTWPMTCSASRICLPTDVCKNATKPIAGILSCWSNADCPGGRSCLSNFTCETDPTGLQRSTFENLTRLAADDAGSEYPLADGFTATGPALLSAFDTFETPADPMAPPYQNIIIHLSDGLANRPAGDPVAPIVEAWNRHHAGIALLYDFPLFYTGGAPAPEPPPELAASPVPDASFPGRDENGEDMIPLFFEANATMRGQSLARNHLELPDMPGPAYHDALEYPIYVEEGAERITYMLSKDPKRLEPYVLHFTELESPSGERYNIQGAQPGMKTIHGTKHAMISVDETLMETGTWKLKHQKSSGNWEHPEYYVSAFVENPEPGCHVAPAQRVYTDGDVALIRARATYQMRTLVEGVTIAGKMVRSDNNLVSLNFVYDETDHAFVARVATSELVGSGTHTVSVTCDVAEGATFVLGDTHIPDDDLVDPPLVPQFRRAARADFQFASATLGVPLPGTHPQDEDALEGLPPGFAPGCHEDCDKDGIPTEEESGAGTHDLDGDGIPSGIDRDDNGNGINDGADEGYEPGNDDGDDVPWVYDNCPTSGNPDQTDTDGDGRGDVCDNCPLMANPEQNDGDADYLGDACDTDGDGDLVTNDGSGPTGETDNCPDHHNPDQSDIDGDGIGDVCDADIDDDGESYGADNCPFVANADQLDSDGDGAGDACDNCLGISNTGQEDTDGDGVGALCDNCPDAPNGAQVDSDNNGAGDACDGDFDGDGIDGSNDNCGTVANEDQADFDGDGVGDACDSNSLVVDAGPDQMLECNGVLTSVSLDGSASGAPAGALDYQWLSLASISDADQAIASGDFPLGLHNVSLTVSQGALEATDLAVVVMDDTTQPTLTAPPDVTASACGSVDLGTAVASDSCDGDVIIVSDAPATFGAGITFVTWYAVDNLGNVSKAVQRVEVRLGDNPACCPAGSNIIMGTSGNDTLVGTEGDDCIVALGAQDTIDGLGGNDVISAGHGDDVVSSGDGNDYVDGGPGQDQIFGGAGTDTLNGGDGDDIVKGGEGADLLLGGPGEDDLRGEGGNDEVRGEDGDDTLFGGEGDDFLWGGGLHDTCDGGVGTNDFLGCENVSDTVCMGASIEAESMSATTGGAVSGGWNLWSNGSLSASASFATATTTLTVTAKGKMAAGVWPHMNLYVGSTLVDEFVVDSAEWKTFSTTYVGSGTAEQIRIEFDNDYYAGGQDRDLIVDKLELSCGDSMGACSNDTLDPGETDVDCGGPTCGACAEGESCVVATDCTNSFCNLGTCATAASYRFDFENGVQGWTNISSPGQSSTTSSTVAFEGSSSLELNVNGMGDPLVAVMPPTSPQPDDVVEVRYYIPEGAPIYAVSPYLQDANWSWVDGYTSAITKGSWQTLNVTVPSGAVMPLSRVGIKFYQNASYTGVIYVDGVDW